MQQVIGSFSCCGRAVDVTTLKALNSLAARQSKPTQRTQGSIKQFLDCMATHPTATMQHHPSNMTLQVHSDASHLNEAKACSMAGGHCFLGNKLNDNEAIFLNGAVHTLCTMIKHVAASTAEAKLGALFLNAKEAKII